MHHPISSKQLRVLGQHPQILHFAERVLKGIKHMFYCRKINSDTVTTQKIHGTGIFTYTFTIKINHSSRYINNRPRDTLGNALLAAVFFFTFKSSQDGSGSIDFEEFVASLSSADSS